MDNLCGTMSSNLIPYTHRPDHPKKMIGTSQSRERSWAASHGGDSCPYLCVPSNLPLARNRWARHSSSSHTFLLQPHVEAQRLNPPRQGHEGGDDVAVAGRNGVSSGLWGVGRHVDGGVPGKTTTQLRKMNSHDDGRNRAAQISGGIYVLGQSIKRETFRWHNAMVSRAQK